MFFRRFAVKLIFSLAAIQFLSVIDCNKPKLSVITGQTSRLNDQTTVVDIETNSTLRMTCEGTQPIRWRFPENDPVVWIIKQVFFEQVYFLKYYIFDKYSPPISRVSMADLKCFRNGVCKSDLTLPNTQYWQTGLYSCFYNQSIDSKDSMYVFING